MVGYRHSVGVRGDDRLRRGASIVTRSRKLGRSLWIALFKIALVAAILCAISQLDIINAATMARIFSHPVAAGIAIMALAAAIYVSVMRWYLLLMIQGISISLWRLSSITFASYFIGSTTLGSVGTDAMRLYYIGREKPASLGQAYLSIVVDRLVGMTGLLVLGAILFAMNFAEITRHPQMLGLVLFSAAMAAGFVLLAALMVGFNRLISPWLRGLRVIHRVTTHMSLLVHYYRSALPLVGLCVLISVVVHALMLASLVILTWALFGDALSASQLGLAGVMSTLANQIPISPGGLALGEGTFAYLCHLMDPATVTTDYGSAVFLQRVVALIATLPGLFSYLAYRSVGSTQAAEVVGEKVRRAR
jgi:glycosyltransferase 2 family protein